jgi:hypothetical protein
MISYCGLVCTECPAYLATQNDDDERRRSVAETWSRQYGSDLKPEDINCSGCLPGEEVYFSHCLVCDIRACGMDKGVENCAHCADFACDKLGPFLEMVPEAKTRLEMIRATK